MENNLDNNICESCGNCETGKTVIRPQKFTRDLTTRLKRIEGQVKGIEGMIEKGTYCDDVLTQIAAVQSALSSVTKLLLESHMKTCIAERLRNGDDEAIQELIKTIGRVL